jgi:hypothetical protein
LIFSHFYLSLAKLASLIFFFIAVDVAILPAFSSGIPLAVKVIHFQMNDTETLNNTNSPDHFVPEQIGNDCKYIIDFYGAISGGSEVINFE